MAFLHQTRSHGYEGRIQRMGKRTISVVKKNGFGGSFDKSTVKSKAALKQIHL